MQGEQGDHVPPYNSKHDNSIKWKKKNGQGYMKTPVTNTSDSTHMVIHCTGKEWQSKNKSLVWYLLCKALSFSHLG